jgi:hypothetical protein
MANADYRPSVNLAQVQFERARKVVDAAFNAARHELDECFYGDRAEDGSFKRDGLTGWKYGKSAPFRGYDITVATLPAVLRQRLAVQPGQETLDEVQAARLFNTFSGMMELAYSVALVKANRNLAEPYPEEQINPILDLSRLRLFKQAKERMEAEFLRQLKQSNVQTFGDMVALWNSIPMDAGEHAAQPVPLNSKAADALEKLRALEAETGIKARELVGTLPEA